MLRPRFAPRAAQTSERSGALTANAGIGKNPLRGVARFNMKKAKITSACECQARLTAELNEHKQVIAGFARDIRRKQTLPAPAHSIGAQHAIFDVAWACPFCTRNTLRPFHTSGLAWTSADANPAAAR
jgi:hypothetical protein